MKRVIIGALIAAVLINGLIILILYQKKLIFQPKYIPNPIQVETPVAPTTTVSSIGSVDKVKGTFFLTRDQKTLPGISRMAVQSGDLLNAQQDSQINLTTAIHSTRIYANTNLAVVDASSLRILLGKMEIHANQGTNVVADTWQIQSQNTIFTVEVQPIPGQVTVILTVQQGQVTLGGPQGQAVISEGHQATLQNGTVTQVEVPVSTGL